MNLLKLAFSNVFRRKTRTFIAILSIAIGLTALIILVSIVNGIANDVNKTISQMQGLIVFNGSVISPVFDTLNIKYKDKLKIPGVKLVIPEYIHIIGIIDKKKNQFKGLTQSPKAIALDAKYVKFTLYGSVVENLKKNDFLKNKDKGYVVISDYLADKYNKTINSTINIDGKSFKIKDIFYAKTKNEKNTIFFTMEDIRKLYGFKKDEVSLFEVIPEKSEDIDKIKNTLKFKFKDLKIFGKQEMQQQIGDVLNNLRMLVILVALIASLVAAVGVVNSMLMSVMERYKEIGTLKAIGWTSDLIIKMILIESAYIGLFGSLSGLLFAFTLNYILSFFITTFLTYKLIVFAFIFGLAIGIISGIYPAYYATKLNPIDALREE